MSGVKSVIGGRSAAVRKQLAHLKCRVGRLSPNAQHDIFFAFLQVKLVSQGETDSRGKPKIL